MESKNYYQIKRVTKNISRLVKKKEDLNIIDNQPINRLKLLSDKTVEVSFLSFKNLEAAELSLRNSNSQTLNLYKPRPKTYEISEIQDYFAISPSEFPLKNKNFNFFNIADFRELLISECLNEINSLASEYEVILKNTLPAFGNRLASKKIDFQINENFLTFYSNKLTNIGDIKLKNELKLSPNTVFLTIECLNLEASLLDRFDYKIFNQKYSQGKFFRRNSAICYKTAFHYSRLSQLHLDSLEILEDELEEVFIPTLEKYLDVNERKNNDAKVVLKLTKEEIQKNNEIEKILSTEKSAYFNNRLNLGKTKIVSERYGYFYYPKDSKKFEIYGEDCFSQLLDQINELIERLAQYNIYFKIEEFSFDLFYWYNERPVFNYSKPLAQVFEIRHEDKFIEEGLETHRPWSQKSLEKSSFEGNSRDFWNRSTFSKKYKVEIDNKMYTIAKSKHSNKIMADESLMDSNEVSRIEDKVELIPLEKMPALLRLKLNQQNKLFPIRKYYGIHYKDQRCHLVAKKPFTRVFSSNLNSENCLETIKSVLNLFKQFTSKSAFVPCFDSDSFGLNESGKLLIDLKNPSEISPEFQAPEIKSGRTSTLSSVYCFGKLIEHVLLPSLSPERYDYFKTLSKDCTQPSLIKRKKLQDISFD